MTDVRFSYAPPIETVRGVTCALRPGEYVGLVGANGSGKSTLAHLLVGRLAPTAGAIWYGAEQLRGEETTRRDRRERLVLVSADPESQLIATSVYDEVAFSLRARGLPAHEIGKRTERALTQFELLAYAQRHPGMLSVGEQLRVLLAAAVVREPTYLILDEVASMLDNKYWAAMRQLLMRLRSERNIGILVITHRLEDLYDADRALVMAHGSLVCDAPIPEVFSRAAMESDWRIMVPQPYLVSRLARSALVREFLIGRPAPVPMKARQNEL